jgi:hypothetical protein
VLRNMIWYGRRFINYKCKYQKRKN